MPDDARIVSRPERNAATSFRDNAAGEPSEAPASNGRPNDLEISAAEPVLPNSTFASRAKAAKQAQTKQVDAEADVQDKAVSRKRSARK